MKKIKKQQENINTLLKLINENPELEIVPMVDSEIGGYDYSYYMGEWGTAQIYEYHCSDERIYFKEQDFEELVDDFIENSCEEYNDLSDEELEKLAEKEINNLEWIKAIVVNINSI